MEQNVVMEKAVGILKKYAKNEKALAGLTEQTRIIEDLRINSARMIDIVADLEEAFGIRIEDEMADQMDTVGQMVKVLSEKINA